ncbi:4Fe-4S binding protein [Hanstruepera ponticola]|uniref:4Fe-4S binding protein n=1 Tax=Hanstruepera ponticola TaxID=2042995 RepID=UPI000CF1192A|nr:4Fe-4S binding protein [Hanstruepera ponticola]
MKTVLQAILNANQAVAQIAFKTNDIFPIYPITPASEMGELVEQWCAENKVNLFNNTPLAFQMQSEAGVAGTMHGALQTGSLATTFTASQGLLLMLPNMFKIAGELTPNVIHVATRSIATHALSVFGDHSDIMAVRQSGYGLLGSSTVQEAHDFALIAQTATLESRIPFVHFFDGFRTSHETNTISLISDDVIKNMIDNDHIEQHRNRALNPNKPVIKGTSQGPDVFFQSREAINTYYNRCPEIVQKHMDTFAHLTGRHYKLFDYVGHPQAEHIIITMASSCSTIEATINQLNNSGNKLGLIKVRLFRPFSTIHLLKALPKTIKSIAVLDRTKEPGSTGEPLYLDIVQALNQAYQENKITLMPKIVGGRYGLSSKEFTPPMVNAIFQNLKHDQPKNNFTIGITDDVTHLSLDYPKTYDLNNNYYEAIFYQEKTKDKIQSFNIITKLLGYQKNVFVQSYTTTSYKKSNTYNEANLRIGNNPINLPFLINKANFISCTDKQISQNDSIITKTKIGGTILVNTLQSTKGLWQMLSANKQYQIIEKNINLLTVNTEEIKVSDVLKNNSVSAIHSCFLALKYDYAFKNEFSKYKDFIYEVDKTIDNKFDDITADFDTNFNQTLLGQLLLNKGNEVPVSLLPTNGTYPTNTSQFNFPVDNQKTISWHADACTQCGACSMACPLSALRIKVYDDTYLKGKLDTLNQAVSNEFDLLSYTIQVNPSQCNNCNNCLDACPSNALSETNLYTRELFNWKHFETVPEFDRLKINTEKVSQQQLQEPLFKYANGDKGCGEMAYLKVMSQLFGDRLLVANATGSSSIFGGALPTTPWSTNSKGHGPAWSNSLFEDNAEFGLGYRMSINQLEKQAKNLLETLLPVLDLDFDLAYDILKATQNNEKEINEQRERIDVLKERLQQINSPDAKRLLNIADNLVKKSIWIVGGDGWAYDIGFGGLDHVMASGENVNILILDNEVYDNTGGQASKATPLGAQAKFAFGGKHKQKKDLGWHAMNYDNVYVASVAIGANQEQTLKAFNEAESFNGPSLIIAYCHSSNHGIDMKSTTKYHKAAVASGQWLLYRNDPRRKEQELNTLQLDSQYPSIPIEDYLKLESRFSKIADNKQFIQQLQKASITRFHKYTALVLSKPQKSIDY